MTESEIKSRIDELDAQIAPLADERARLEKDLLSMRSPFQVGDFITWKNGDFAGHVVSLKEWVGGKPMWSVKRILKNGKDGMVHDVHPYHNPKLVKKSE